MTEPASPTPPTETRPPKDEWGWIGFFVFVVVASLGAAGFMIWFNLSIQLKPEQFDEAWSLWRKKGPQNYDMVYTKRLNDDAKTDIFKVKVRGGAVKEVRMNDVLLTQDKAAGQEDDPKIHHSMDRLFRDVERFMDLDQKPGAKKVYVTAIFDPDTGALRRYIRRVMGTTLRIELHVTINEVES